MYDVTIFCVYAKVVKQNIGSQNEKNTLPSPSFILSKSYIYLIYKGKRSSHYIYVILNGGHVDIMGQNIPFSHCLHFYNI